MKEWIKNNAVGIVFGILGSIGFIGSVATQVQDMAAAYASVFWWWTAATALLGIAAGAFAAGLGKRKSEDRLASIKEAEETKRRAKAEEEATTRARIEAESKAEIERMKQEQADRKDREAAEAEASRAIRELDEIASKMMGLPYIQADMLLSALGGGGTCEYPKANATAAALEESGLLKKLDSASGNIRATWKVPDHVRAVWEERSDVREALANSYYTAETERHRKEVGRKRREFSALDFKDQLFVYVVLEEGAREMSEWDIRDYSCWGFLQQDKIGPGRVRVKATPATIELFKENEDLLEHVKEYCQQG